MATQPYNKLYNEETYGKVLQENKAICDDFLKECKARKLASSTQQQYANDCRWICCFIFKHLNNQSLLKLTKRSFRDFMIICSEEYELSSARCNRLLSCIHQLLNFCEEDDELYEDYTRNASEKVKGLPKNPERDIVFLSDDIIEKLWKKLKKEKRYEEATLCAILYDSGSRRNEIAQIKRDSIREDANATNVVVGKRAKKFKVIYFSRTKESYKLYESARTDDSDLLFPNDKGEAAYMHIYNLVVSWRKDLLEITGKEYNVNPHSFRHSFVQNLLDGSHYLCREKDLGSIPLEKIKSLCHHESSDTTLKYAMDNTNKDIEDLFGINLIY